MKKEFAITGSTSLKEAFVKEAKLSVYDDRTISNFSHLVPYSLMKRGVQGSVGGGTRTLFTLPQDYEKAMKYVNSYYTEEKKKTEKKEKAVDISTLKRGDFVVVLKEDDNYDNSEKCVQMVSSTSNIVSGWVQLLFKNGSTNSYNKVRMATKAEIKKAFPIPDEIEGYENEMTKGRVSYGCKEFTKEEVKTLIDAMEILNRIGDYLDSMSHLGISFTEGESLTLGQLYRIYSSI